MLSRVRGVFTFSRKKKIPREVIEAKDTQLIQKFAGLASSLGEVSADTEHALSSETKNIVSLVRDSHRRLDYSPNVLVHQSIYKHLEEKLQTLTESVKALEYQDSAEKKDELATKLWLRLNLLKEYLKKLEATVASGEIERSKLTTDKMESLVEKTLVGTGTERLDGECNMHCYTDGITDLFVLCRAFSAVWRVGRSTSDTTNVLYLLRA
jgi:hypothetical protein